MSFDTPTLTRAGYRTLENTIERNKLRQVIKRAEDKDVMSKEEVGFAVMLVERYAADIEKKTKQLYMMQGEISQLKLNERIIIQLIDNLIAAAERDEARQRTMLKIRGEEAAVEEEEEVAEVAEVEEEVEE